MRKKIVEKKEDKKILTPHIFITKISFLMLMDLSQKKKYSGDYFAF